MSLFLRVIMANILIIAIALGFLLGGLKGGIVVIVISIMMSIAGTRQRNHNEIIEALKREHSDGN